MEAEPGVEVDPQLTQESTDEDMLKNFDSPYVVKDFQRKVEIDETTLAGKVISDADAVKPFSTGLDVSMDEAVQAMVLMMEKDIKSYEKNFGNN